MSPHPGLDRRSRNIVSSCAMPCVSSPAPEAASVAPPTRPFPWIRRRPAARCTLCFGHMWRRLSFLWA